MADVEYADRPATYDEVRVLSDLTRAAVEAAEKIRIPNTDRDWVTRPSDELVALALDSLYTAHHLLVEASSCLFDEEYPKYMQARARERMRQLAAAESPAVAAP